MEIISKFKNIPIKVDTNEYDIFMQKIEIETYSNLYNSAENPFPKSEITKEEFINLCGGKIVKNISECAFAYEDPITKIRTWFSNPFVGKMNFLLQTHSAVIHEVVKEKCRFYCDLDGNNGDNDEFLESIDVIKDNFCQFFAYFFKNTNQVKTTNFAINFFVAVSNASYNSAHIYIDIIDKDTNAYYCMNSPSQQEPFWKSYMKYLDTLYTTKEFTDMLDTTVYRYNAQLRCINSASPKSINKPGTGILLPSDDEFYRLKYFKTDGLVRLQDCKIKIKRGYTIEDFLIVPNNRVHYTVLDYENEDEIIKPIFYTQYEKLCFAEILKTSTKNVDSYSIWRKACFRVYCFYHFLPLVHRKKVVCEFFAARGWKNPNHILENEDLCDEWFKKGRHCNFSIDSLQEYFEIKKQETIDFCADEVSYPKLQPGDNKIICMRSGTKTKKSFNFINTYKDCRTLCITYRISLADELVKNAKNQGINYVHYQEYELNVENPPQHFVCQLESLYKYADIIDSFDVVFIDESEAFFGQFNHVLETNSRVLPELQYIFEIIMNQKNVIFASANLAERTTTFIKDYKKLFEFFNNNKKDKVGWSYVDCESVNAFMKTVKQLAAQGKKLIIPTNNKTTFMMELVVILQEYGKVLTITADDSDIVKKDIDSWINYDFVIHSPTIESGINFLPEHFDNICGLFFNKVNTYDSCYQMLFRARNPKSKVIYLYAAPGHILKKDDLENEKEIERRMQIKKNKTENFMKRIMFNNASFVYDKYMHPIYKAIKRHELFRKYSRAYFKKLLVKELEMSGVVKDSVINDTDGYFATEGKKLKKMYNNKVVNNIVDNNGGTAKEYIFRLGEIHFPINLKDLNMFTKVEIPNRKNPDKTTYELITELIENVRNHMGLKNNLTQYFNPEQDVIYKLTQIIIPGKEYEDDEFNELLKGFFKDNYKVWTATFEARKYKLQDVLNKKLGYKILMMNPQLKKCYFKIVKNYKYSLQPFNRIFLDQVNEKIDKYKIEMNKKPELDENLVN